MSAWLTTFWPSREPSCDRSQDTKPLPPQAVDVPFLITASELRDRKNKRRRKQDDLPGRYDAFRRLVELGLKAKK
jgi:hypothetical protein